MGLPNTNIVFKTTAASAIKRRSKGVVAIIIKDTKSTGKHILTNATQVPEDLGNENKEYIERAFLGYVHSPRKVILYVQDLNDTDLTDGLTFMQTQQFDYLVGPPDGTEEEANSIASWIKSKRENGFIYRAVLPNIPADSEGIINFTMNENKVGNKIYTASEYCSRIAGLIAGTPMTISCTYATLPELTDVNRMTKDEMDAAIDNGKLILLYDGEKVKVGRGINSLQTVTADKGDTFKKIKIIEAVDMIKNDIHMSSQDSYIGKYPNSYDDKCLLITGIRGYFQKLAADKIVSPDFTVGMNIDKQKNFLQEQGKDVSKMSDLEIREADTGTHVFISCKVKILDAIEDIDVAINI